jgi:hypothetical protein
LLPGFGNRPACEDTTVPRPRFIARRAGPIGLLFTAWDLWRRLPPKQRQMIVQQARTHGPRLAKGAAARTRARRASSRRKPKP